MTGGIGASSTARGVLLDLEDADAERLYLYLTAHPHASLAQVVHALGISEGGARRAGAALVAHRAATVCETGWLRVMSPQAAARARLARLQDELTSTRLAVEAVEDEYVRARTTSAGVVRIIEREELQAVVFDAQARARAEVREIMKAPFVVPSRDSRRSHSAWLSSGVTYRSIYDHSVVLDRDRVDELLYAKSLGAQVRLLKDAPMKLLLFDDSLAIAAFTSEKSPVLQALVVQPSALFDALSTLFESLFEISLSLEGATCDSEVSDDEMESQLLGLMAAGYTDAAIARHWRVSTRTVERRISALMQRLGVTSRFQAGLAARSRGWI